MIIEVDGELEQLVSQDIKKWYLTTAVERIETNKQLYNTYWNKYFESCEMDSRETGLEMPHEENTTYSYHPNADEYNSRSGW